MPRAAGEPFDGSAAMMKGKLARMLPDSLNMMLGRVRYVRLDAVD